VKSIEAPALVFAGDKDRMVRTRSVRHMCALNPRFKLHTWEDVGHVAQLEVPERVLPEIERFFAANPMTDAAKAA
jgi:pimeloyl-ACP methyl ester carboxylesterase